MLIDTVPRNSRPNAIAVAHRTQAPPTWQHAIREAFFVAGIFALAIITLKSLGQ